MEYGQEQFKRGHPLLLWGGTVLSMDNQHPVPSDTDVLVQDESDMAIR